MNAARDGFNSAQTLKELRNGPITTTHIALSRAAPCVPAPRPPTPRTGLPCRRRIRGSARSAGARGRRQRRGHRPGNASDTAGSIGASAMNRDALAPRRVRLAQLPEATRGDRRLLCAERWSGECRAEPHRTHAGGGGGFTGFVLVGNWCGGWVRLSGHGIVQVEVVGCAG